MRFADVLLVFFLAWLVAFILSPLARFLSRWRYISRGLAVAIVYIGLLLLMVMAGLLILPATATQLSQLGTSLPGYVERAPEFLAQVQAWLDERSIPIRLDSLYQEQGLAERAQSLGTALAQNALGLAQGVAQTIFNSILVLVLSFYIALDGERIGRDLVRLAPQRHREEAEFLLATVGQVFGGYMRGTIITAAIYGLGTALVMWWQGLGFILPISAFAGAMMIIPLFGALLAIITPLVIALFSGPWERVILVAAALLLWQQVLLHVVGPRVMSQEVGIHPLLVLFAILAGAKLAGLWGIIFGVPVAAIIYSLGVFFYRRRVPSQGAQ